MLDIEPAVDILILRPYRALKLVDELLESLLPFPMRCSPTRLISPTRAIWGFEASGEVPSRDSYDNALAETIIGLYKTEVIRRRGLGKASTT
jgi:hypothetical protein